MKYVAATVTLPPPLLLLLLRKSPGTSPGRASDSAVAAKDSAPSSAAPDLDRSILLQWRASSPQLRELWSDKDAPTSAWEGVSVGKNGRVVKLALMNWGIEGDLPAALGGLTALETFEPQRESPDERAEGAGGTHRAEDVGP
jgi:hypothetical protein